MAFRHCLPANFTNEKKNTILTLMTKTHKCLTDIFSPTKLGNVSRKTVHYPFVYIKTHDSDI
jgi:hypothetical protein